MGNILSKLDETLGGLRIIKAFNADNYQRAQLEKANNAYRNTLSTILLRRDLASPLSEFLGITIFVILLWYGGQLVFSKEMLPATFIVYLGIFQQIINPAKSFSQAIYNIRKATASLDRLDEIIDAPETITDPEAPIPLSSFVRNIRYQNVSFQYEDDRQILKDISFTIKKGKITALVGSSGSGKSTIADLLPRFYDVSQGGIFIDDINIREVRLTDLRGLMGIVSQEAILFNDTIYNNIVFGMEGATPEKVAAAAKVANAHEFIDSLPQGYATLIGDRGAK
jgi:subfamily B ATP-binding cassette protein MsbA